MSLNLIPDFMFDDIYSVTPDFLTSLGVSGVILDIDNTLVPYENDRPTECVLSWLSSLREAGIRCAIVSNNNKKRVDLFNFEISLPAYYHSAKPFADSVKRAMKDIERDKSECIFIGDQILTDVWAAHNAGIRAVLVNPIKDKTDPFTRLKRKIEKHFIKKYKERKNNVG
ncbi:MAG: YqeG family HAD IIIA-type phosphatase [Clostridia bacterium]|nr:YqeG family HAD IIIA-type phosphatase [Clostridia bacterium]